jgi:transcriptional regulator GlxA family with amidase domain
LGASCELLDQRYEALTVEPDPIFVEDGPIWTSAGVSAGIDLSLALVQADCGRDIAMRLSAPIFDPLDSGHGECMRGGLRR